MITQWDIRTAMFSNINTWKNSKIIIVGEIFLTYNHK